MKAIKKIDSLWDCALGMTPSKHDIYLTALPPRATGQPQYMVWDSFDYSVDIAVIHHLLQEMHSPSLLAGGKPLESNSSKPLPKKGPGKCS